jgi:hypothetical protein
VEATAPTASTRGLAVAPSARCCGVGVVGADVGVRNCVVRFVDMSKRFGLVISWVYKAVCFVMVIVVMSVYICFVVVCGTIGTLHRSHVGWWRGAACIRKGVFLAVCRSFGWSRSLFCWYVSFFNRRVFV